MSDATHITSDTLTRMGMSHRIIGHYLTCEGVSYISGGSIKIILKTFFIIIIPSSNWSPGSCWLSNGQIPFSVGLISKQALPASLPPCPQALGAKSFAAMMMTMMMIAMVMMTLMVMELMRRVHITIIIMNGDFGRSLLFFMSDIPCLHPRVTNGNFNIDLRLWLKREKFNPCDL